MAAITKPTATMAQVPELPPEDLIVRVAGIPDPEWFLISGRRSVAQVNSALGLIGRSIIDFPRVLDFGCGCGRMMLHLEDYLIDALFSKVSECFRRVLQQALQFEAITEQLGEISHFRKEPFFWTIIGLRMGAASSVEEGDRIEPWPDKIDFERTYTLLIYVYRPRDPAWPRGIGQLIVKSEVPLSSLTSPDIIIDSPYDLRRWSFKVRRPHIAFRDTSWLRIGQEGVQEDAIKAEALTNPTPASISKALRRLLNGSVDWEIDLPLSFRFSWLHAGVINFVLGVLLAAPSILVILRQTGTSEVDKVIYSLFALAFGIAAAAVATFGVKKIS